MKVLFFIVCAFATFSLISQTNVSLHGGLNYSNAIVEPSELVDFESLNLIHAGLEITFKISDNVNIVSLLQYSQKGNGFNDPVSSFFSPALRLHYLDLLPTIEFKIIDAIGLYGGANIGYLFRVDGKFQSDGWEKIEDLSMINKNDMGLVVGTRFYIGTIGIHAHWNRGLNNVDTFNLTDANGNILSESSYKNNNFQLGLSLYL